MITRYHLFDRRNTEIPFFDALKLIRLVSVLTFAMITASACKQALIEPICAQ